ncbi:hypothetical protein J437_LFUL000386 [Ladona fulva]|uniref:C2H2-type domain-containing protein n=1 Tax=Ladona fulva TaxID=123851 RepID=A0A8K0K3M8_LADFU|nr:hypothetical protein J437_LFUL000386 [Ladona fulva]
MLSTKRFDVRENHPEVSLHQKTPRLKIAEMAPLKTSLTCSVCDEELSSVSTLHYHQMCLHTTEELSLAILSLRELSVNLTSPTEGGATGHAPSPSTDCEDMLLRNGLAKYPRFLHVSGGKKSKLSNSEGKTRSMDDENDSLSKNNKDKENILLDKSSVTDLDKVDNGGSVDRFQNDLRINAKNSSDSSRSRLWGTIKTLDGKTVDVPVVKIDNKRQVLKPNHVRDKESPDHSCLDRNTNSSSKSLSSRVTEETVNLPENADSNKRKNRNIVDSDVASDVCGDKSSLENSTEVTKKQERDGRQLNRCESEVTDGNCKESQDSDVICEKDSILKRQLEMMNMSSFDDVIEFDCSDDSDEEEEIFDVEAVSNDEESFENGEDEGDVSATEIMKEDTSLVKCEGHVSSGEEKRTFGKLSMHRSWYSGNTNHKPQAASGNGVRIGKRKKVGGHMNRAVEPEVLVSEVEGVDVNLDSRNGDPSETIQSGTEKIYLDSSVQTDYIIEDILNESSRSSPSVRKEASSNKRGSTRKTPKRKYGRRKFVKNQKDDHFIKPKKVIKREVPIFTKNVLMDGNVKVKPEIIDLMTIASGTVIVNGEKRFYCNECSKTYKKRSHLDRHKRVHTGERPFVCSYCEKGFSVRSILNQHVRIHTGEKPYSCNICSARFPQKSGLMTHMMLHTGKPFKCDQCDKSFVSNHKLINHMKGHAGDRPYNCDVCSSAFFTAAALHDHQMMHSRSRKHICSICNASFVHEVYLKIHLASHLMESGCVEPMDAKSAGSVSSHHSTSPQSNTSPENSNEISLTLDAIDQFCNGETIMMDLAS